MEIEAQPQLVKQHPAKRPLTTSTQHSSGEA
jgi:hypothetical protein